LETALDPPSSTPRLDIVLNTAAIPSPTSTWTYPVHPLRSNRCITAPSNHWMNERASATASLRIVYELAKSVGWKLVPAGSDFDYLAVQMESPDSHVVRVNRFFLDHSVRDAVKECLERNAKTEGRELLCAAYDAFRLLYRFGPASMWDGIILPNIANS